MCVGGGGEGGVVCVVWCVSAGGGGGLVGVCVCEVDMSGISELGCRTLDCDPFTPERLYSDTNLKQE